MVNGVVGNNSYRRPGEQCAVAAFARSWCRASGAQPLIYLGHADEPDRVHQVPQSRRPTPEPLKAVAVLERVNLT
jgi:hypothetical protein